MITIRKAVLADIGEVASLLVSSFGHLAIAEGALSYFIDRYYVAISDTGHIIGVSGIVPEEDHYTITFSCVNIRYRNQGVMDKLFRYILKDYDKNKSITLRAWHLPDKERANLDGIAKRYGFILIKSSFVNRIKGITQCCNDCIYNNKKECQCSDDLYLLDMVDLT